MKFRTVIVLTALLVAASTFAQAPKGWKMRVDRSLSASDPDGSGVIKFVTAGSGFHAMNPQAAVFWNPGNTISGSYSLKATFTLLRPSSHTNYYGLVFGGSDLEGSGQTYLYFVVGQDGTWLLKRRDGNVSTQDVVPRARNAAVKTLDSSGKSVNQLEVRVGADKVDYLVNGTVVQTTPKAGLKTDGLYGIRINHQLDVQIDGLSAVKQ